MDHFESIVATLLEADGYWVRRSFKVNVTREEKRIIGKHSIPRPEIDLVAYNPGREHVLALEAKSFLDSPGVDIKELQQDHIVPEGRYKLFTSRPYREVVLARLHSDLMECGMLRAETRITLGLVAGKVRSGGGDQLRSFLTERGFMYWGPDDIRSKVTALAARGYENDPAIITAKILMRSTP
jgi:hypothetical protein